MPSCSSSSFCRGSSSSWVAGGVDEHIGCRNRLLVELIHADPTYANTYFFVG